MSFVTTLPELVSSAAGQLQAIGSSVTAANALAAFPITGVIPAAADEVSALTAASFARYGLLYQAISAEAALIHEQFVTALSQAANAYMTTEIGNVMQTPALHPGVPQPTHSIPAMPTTPAPVRVAPAMPATPAVAPAPAPAVAPAPGAPRMAPVAPARVSPARMAPVAPTRVAPTRTAPVAPARVSPAALRPLATAPALA